MSLVNYKGFFEFFGVFHVLTLHCIHTSLSIFNNFGYTLGSVVHRTFLVHLSFLEIIFKVINPYGATRSHDSLDKLLVLVVYSFSLDFLRKIVERSISVRSVEVRFLRLLELKWWLFQIWCNLNLSKMIF